MPRTGNPPKTDDGKGKKEVSVFSMRNRHSVFDATNFSLPTYRSRNIGLAASARRRWLRARLGGATTAATIPSKRPAAPCPPRLSWTRGRAVLFSDQWRVSGTSSAAIDQLCE
jgi:hypothetical protein